MSESISKNKELENEMTLDMSYFWYSDTFKYTFLAFRQAQSWWQSLDPLTCIV